MSIMDLEGVRREVVGCTRCGLCRTRTNAVPGKGGAGARIVFVGEAPGRTEDERGEPFVGSAGRRLDEALRKGGIPRESVYITNVVKCRPPENRVPTDEERGACARYLEAELSIIKPEIICVLGNTASESVLGIRDITKNRGRVIERGGRKYFLTFHPAAVIYNRELASVFEGDIAELARIVHEG